MRNYCDNVDPKHPYRERANVPAHLSRNVCLCDNQINLVCDPKSKIYNKCRDCGNIPVYFIYKCTYCDTEFLHDFTANFCYKEPLCFEHNPMNAYCIGHKYCITHVSDSSVVPPSTKLKLAFTQEQLDNVFDF